MTAGRRSRPIRRSRAGATSTTTPGSCTTSRPTARSSTTWRREQPDKLRELVNLWYAEAGRNGAFPLDDRSALEIILTPRPQMTAPRNRYTYYPDLAEVPEAQAVNLRNRSFAIGALVDIPAPGAEGVIFSQGARFGGHSLYVKDNRLHYVNNFVGMFEQKIDATEDLPIGENLILAASFEKDGEDPPHVSTGILSLYHGDTEGRRGPDQDAAGHVLAGRRGPVRSGATAASRSPTTTRASRRTASRAARSTGSRSTSAASRTSTSSARPRRCSPGSSPRLRPAHSSRRRQGVGDTRQGGPGMPIVEYPAGRRFPE